MRFQVQTRLSTNWHDVHASRDFAVANLTAYTTPFADVAGIGFPWGIYAPGSTDMLKVLNDDGTLIGFALFDNTARHWGEGNPMLVMDVYADSDKTLAAMMAYLTELARNSRRSRAEFVDVGHPNERGKAALKKLGFTRVAFAYISGAGGQTPTVRKMSSLEFETAKGNVPGLVAMTSLSKAGLSPGGAPFPEDLEKKVTGFLSPEGREERPEIALSKTALILRKTGVPTRPEAAPAVRPRAPHGGPGPAAAGAGAGTEGGRRRRTVRRRKTRKSRRQVKSRH
jgi:hypothetical protein